MTENEKIPIHVEPQVEYISIGDMLQLCTASIKFRGVMIHADCRTYKDHIFVLVHLKQPDGKMYANVVNIVDELNLLVTIHQLTMWLHNEIKTLDLQEVSLDD